MSSFTYEKFISHSPEIEKKEKKKDVLFYNDLSLSQYTFEATLVSLLLDVIDDFKTIEHGLIIICKSQRSAYDDKL
jgi:hypothetical protein